MVTMLREKRWSKPVGELLETIAVNLLHSGFDEIMSAIDRFVE